MNGYTENKAARYRLPNTTTMEDLAMEVNATVGAVLKMGDKVLVADRWSPTGVGRGSLPGFTSSLTHRKKRAWTKLSAG